MRMCAKMCGLSAQMMRMCADECMRTNDTELQEAAPHDDGLRRHVLDHHGRNDDEPG